MSDNIQELFSRLDTEALAHYLTQQGWEKSSCRWSNRIRFEGDYHSGGKRYELLIPSSAAEADYRKHLQHAIYKLCGIEDREPMEVMRDVLESKMTETAGQRIRVRNSGTSALKVIIDSRATDHQLHPGDSIEIVQDANRDSVIEIERTDTTLWIK